MQPKVVREGCQHVSSLFGESRAYRVLGLGLIGFRVYRVLGLGFRPLHLGCPKRDHNFYVQINMLPVAILRAQRTEAQHPPIAPPPTGACDDGARPRVF